MNEKLDRIIDKVEESGNRLTKIETKLDNIEAILSKTTASTSLHNDRITRLETQAGTMKWGIGIFLTILGISFSFLTKLIK